MKTLEVRVRGAKDYQLLIGGGLLSRIDSLVDLSSYTKLFVITDANVARFYLDDFLTLYSSFDLHSYVAPAGEDAKSLAVYERILEELCQLNFDKKGLIINLGGGVVTDLGGFVASTYRRGSDFLNISTTLEGMVDASVGGKNGVNLGKYKNYVGTFAHPRAVVMDVDTLKTLDSRSFLAGWAEVIKHGLIADPDYYRFATSKHPGDFSQQELIEIIGRSCEIKRDVVEEDEREGGKRKVLNFGHTIGHALESISYQHDYLLHGEAIAIGMVAEGYISYKLGFISAEDFQELKRNIAACGLPTSVPFKLPDTAPLMDLIEKDKKNFGNEIKWSLIKPVGSCAFDVHVSAAVCVEALAQVLQG